MRRILSLCVAGVLALAACEHATATGLCACSPTLPAPSVVKATVLTAAEVPAANARVVVETLADNACDVAASGQVYGIGTTNAAGVLYLPFTRVSNVPWCVRVTAEGAQAEQGRPSSPALVTLRATLPTMPTTPDTTALTLRLRL
jgi:hypothetical protein